MTVKDPEGFPVDAQGSKMLSHYRLVEKIGEGGMGVVWKAEDTILNRTVALKVLPSTRILDEERRRMFLNEARLAASVSHSHVVHVHELGREGDLDFIVMEYVEGEPLNRIMRGKPLPLDRVADLGRQIAQGLARAHREGLVHRDLKPANIIVTPEGEVKIVDFGLATLAAKPEPSESEQTATVTETAGEKTQTPVAGTLPYMSPEQVSGEKLDPRSDIFSLGVVLYEMTTGQRPFRAATPAGLAGEILRSAPRPVHELVPEVPLDLERIIEKTLARRPADRYQVTDDIAVDLKRLSKDLESGSSPSYRDLRPAITRAWRRWAAAAAIVLVVAAAGTGVWVKWLRSRAGPEGRGRTVLVLPMEFLGQADGGDYAGRAFAEAMAINLAQAEGLTVLPVPKIGNLGGSGGIDLSRVARQMGADLVLTGSLVRDGKSVKATLTAIDPKRNRILCGTQETANDGDLARVASTTTRDLADRLGVAQSKRYDYFRYLSWTPEMAKFPGLSDAVIALRRHDVPAGLAATQRLIEAFPNEYDAHAMRLVALVDAENFDPSQRNLDAETAELDTMARIDPKAPIVDLYYPPNDSKTRLEKRNRLLQRSDLTPAFRSHVLRERATQLQSMDSTAAALAGMEEALQLDPANPFNYSYLARIQLCNGHPDEAIDRMRQAIALDPNMAWSYTFLAQILESQARWDEALQNYKTACGVNDTQAEWSVYAHALWRAGRREDAIKTAKIGATKPEAAVGSYVLACVYALTGYRREALHLLRRSIALGYVPESIAMDSDLASLRGDPEFKLVVKEVEQRLRNDQPR